MMRNLILLCLLLVGSLNPLAQVTRVAILDFDNISGIVKYDGLGKAMSSMLISDIEANVSPKRLQLVERAQIQKVLKEQNFQASGNVNKSTAVEAGKILGVNYLLVGDVYILNDQLIINARLTNTETGDIVFSKKQEGKTVAWLTLKTNIAKDIAISLSQPFIEPTIPDKEISVATITTFGNAVAAKDSGNVQMAETLSSTVIDFNPEFRYVDDLRKEIDELKKQVEKNTADIKILTEEVNENVTDYLELGYKYADEKNFSQAEKYFSIGFNKVSKSEIVDYLDYILALSELYYNYGKYIESLKYSEIGLDVYPYFKEFNYFKYNSLAKLNRLAEFDQIVKTAQDIRKDRGDSLIVACLKTFSEKNKVNYYTIEKYLEWKLDGFTSLIKAIRFKNYIPYYSEYGGEFYFNQNFAATFNTLALGCIQEVYNEKPEHAASLLKQLDLSNSSYEDAFEVKFSVAWYTMLTGDFTGAKKQWDDIVLNDFPRISSCADYGQSKANLQFPIDEIIDCIKSSGCINWASVSESKKMALINWAHSYMLSGETSKAIKIYQLFPSDFKFSEDFQHMTYAQVLKSDWNDFVKSQLISKDKIEKMQTLIITNK